MNCTVFAKENLVGIPLPVFSRIRNTRKLGQNNDFTTKLCYYPEHVLYVII